MKKLLVLMVLIAGCAETPRPEVSTLRAKLAADRMARLDALHAYWAAGDFVRNPDPQGGRGHFIKDDRGRACPLASCIQKSGNADLVDHLAVTDNNIEVKNTAAGPLIDWILSSGLTREECILIQEPSEEGNGGSPGRLAATHEEIRTALMKTEAKLRAETEQSLDLAVERSGRVAP